MAYRPGLDKWTILQAATELADAQGLEQVTLAALAGRLQVKPPSLYNHIQGLPGLRKELALYGINRLKEALTQAALGKSGEDAVFAAGLAYVDFVRRHPGLYEAILIVPNYMDEDIQHASEEILNVLLRIIEEYRFSEEEALHMVRGLRSLVHGFATLEQKGGFGMDLDKDESLNLLLRAYLRGLKKQ